MLGTLIEHLALYAVAEDSPGIPEEVQLFELFSEHAGKIIESRTQMPAEEIVSIQVDQLFHFILPLLIVLLDCLNESGLKLLSRPNRVC